MRFPRLVGEIYFVSFYLIMVMFLANVLTSLVIEVTGVFGGRSLGPETVDVAVSTFGNARVRVYKARAGRSGRTAGRV